MDGVVATASQGNLSVAVDGKVETPAVLTGVGAEMFAGAYVMATSGRGFNPDELAEMCVNKLLAVSIDLPPDELAKAHAYRDRIKALLTVYMAQAQKSERTSMFNVLMNAGHESAAELVRSI